MSAEFPILSTHWIREAELLARFQILLSRCADDSARKRLILDAHAEGALTDAECGLLITAHRLEAA